VRHQLRAERGSKVSNKAFEMQAQVLQRPELREVWTELGSPVGIDDNSAHVQALQQQERREMGLSAVAQSAPMPLPLYPRLCIDESTANWGPSAAALTEAL
jgi:hypothetical protein